MIINLIAFIFIGTFFNLQGMANTAIVFLIIYAIESCVHFQYKRGINLWPTVFFVCLLMYKCAL